MLRGTRRKKSGTFGSDGGVRSAKGRQNTSLFHETTRLLRALIITHLPSLVRDLGPDIHWSTPWDHSDGEKKIVWILENEPFFIIIRSAVSVGTCLAYGYVSAQPSLSIHYIDRLFNDDGSLGAVA